MLIGRDGGLSTLRHSCGFGYQQRVLKTFRSPGYLFSEDGVVNKIYITSLELLPLFEGRAYLKVRLKNAVVNQFSMVLDFFTYYKYIFIFYKMRMCIRLQHAVNMLVSKYTKGRGNFNKF